MKEVLKKTLSKKKMLHFWYKTERATPTITTIALKREVREHAVLNSMQENPSPKSVETMEFDLTFTQFLKLLFTVNR